ncbi:MAG: aspartate aminotransferase family protein [Lachnospiraceae bacterium]|nr:aspartate aminotransferase family protein [Lachnospiraceae bacterium]
MSKTMQEYIEEGEQVLLHAYNRYQIALDKGEGMYLYDLDGKKYLDFCAGIAVFALGYGNKRYNDALKDQVDKLLHTSNYYYSVPTIEAAKKLTKVSGMDRVFFTNSGAEAIEGAIKTARKYAYTHDGSTDHEIIAMNHSFHGRTMGALSVTGNEKYQKPFMPMIGNIRFADFNDLKSVKALVNDKTCAIIMETVQGEGGIHPADPEFIKGIRQLCDENDILLILDEIQCGMGRSGKMFAFEHYGVKPDILTVAKAVGCGVPVGAFLMTQKVANDSIKPGDHGTTYGGNPLAGRAVSTVLDIFEEEKITEHVASVSRYLTEKLEELVMDYDCLIGHRGLGLMQGLVFDTQKKSPAEVVKTCLANGLILISAGPDVIRFLPPLIVTEKEIDEMLQIFRKALV